MSERREEIRGILQEIFEEVFDDEVLLVSDDLTSNDVEEWDSLTHITMIVAVEGVFSIKFKASVIEDLKNVGELISILVGLTSNS